MPLTFDELTETERAEFFNQHVCTGDRGLNLLGQLAATANDEYLSEESRAEKIANINAALAETAATEITAQSARDAVAERAS